MGSIAPRVDDAVRLTRAERRETMESFFTSHPGIGGGLGLGQAVLDFQGWEIASGRIGDRGGSAWWRAVNGMMVLDVGDATNADAEPTPAINAWRAYAERGDQASLWEAHQQSLHSAIGYCAELLARETRAEQAFAAIVVDVVDRTALTNRPTNTRDLKMLTERFYPASYPIGDAALAPLEHMRQQTAERLRGADGAVFSDVGLSSGRWRMAEASDANGMVHRRGG